jgi:hypothetical protein
MPIHATGTYTFHVEPFHNPTSPAIPIPIPYHDIPTVDAKRGR